MGRKPRLFYIDGRALSAWQIAEETDLPVGTIHSRVHKGWEGERLMFPKDPTYITFGKYTKLITEWQEVLNLSDKDTVELYKWFKGDLLKNEDVNKIIKCAKEYEAKELESQV